MDTSKFPGFLVDRYTDDTGYLGPPDSTSPAAMYYRRDLAKKYLGTDDPEEVGKLIGAGEASWDKFLAVGEKLKADSNGEVFLIPGLGDMINVLKKQPKSDWRDGNTLTVKENYLPHFQMLKDIRDKGLDAKTEQWSAAWNAMYANGNVLFFPGASWYVGFVVGLNDKDGNGRWGITGTPVANWAWGGSGLTIPKASKNKEAALAWITWWYSMEGAKTMYDAIGSLPAQPEFLEDPFFNQPEEILGGMKLGEFWKDKYDGIYSRKVTADDAVFEEGLVLAVNAIGTGSKTPEQAVEDLAKEIKGRVPGLK
jgi:multiple sugar transport system substrate-binding protein